jgi:hypothetical protein
MERQCRGACAKRLYILNKLAGDLVKTKNFFAELKRRKVYRVAVAYAVVSWLLIQIATQVFPFFEVPTWAVRLVIVLLALGFPVALLLAWAFDLTPEGIKRTDELDEAQQDKAATGLKSIRATPVVSPPEKSIAVLPFDNFSDDMQNAYFADGIQDDNVLIWGGNKVSSRAA